MRLPIILMLLTIFLLPADLEGLAGQVQATAHTAQAMVVKLLKRDDVQVAEASSRVALGNATEVQ